MEISSECAICQKPNPENNHFFRKHRITLADYYEQFFPKKDLLTGDKIPFKTSIKAYLLTDFIDRRNVLKYLTSKPKSQARDYCMGYIHNLMKVKELRWAPSQIELRSVIGPTKATFDKLFKNDIYEDLRLKSRFQPCVFDTIADKFNDSIIIDTREQRPVQFKQTEFEVGQLPYGDYGVKEGSIFIERKNIGDFIASFGGGFSRLCNEFERAEKDDSYIYVLVESPIYKCLNFNHNPYFKKISKGKMKATPEWIFSNVRHIMQQFRNVQFLFLKSRAEMESAMRILFSNSGLRNIDIQYAYESKQLAPVALDDVV